MTTEFDVPRCSGADCSSKLPAGHARCLDCARVLAERRVTREKRTIVRRKTAA